MIVRAMMVAALCFVLVAQPGCRGRQKPNQKQPLTSPSGTYVLTVPIERNPNQGGSNGWWTVTVSDVQGVQLYKDPDSHFAGWLNAYWTWDKADRVWLYNSDDGRVFFWEIASLTTEQSSQPAMRDWVKTEWTEDDPKLKARGLAPPLEVYPDYIRARTQPKP